MRKWQWILKQFSSKLWVRASLFCVLAILTAFLALLLDDYLPEGFSRKVGAKAVDGILQIIASSMLAVTTFSLSTMVAAYTAATANVTPRSTKLLLQDSTAQNALSVFIGAFLFSLVSIIALSMEVYGNNGRAILFIVTLVVIAVIVGVLLQWINYLARLGRVGETINMVEKATGRALERSIKVPHLGGKVLENYTPSPSHYPLYSKHIGYIQHIDVVTLSELAEEHNLQVFLCMLPGAFNDGTEPVLYLSSGLDEGVEKRAADALSIGNQRSFEQDPRFGMVVLSEIASRALSPAVNDPGTAIDVISTGVRTLAPWVNRPQTDKEPLYPRVHVPPLYTADLLSDLFTGIIRDGAGMIEVGIRLQNAFTSLSKMGDKEGAKEAARLSRYALEYAQQKLTLQAEMDRLRELEVRGET